MDLRLTPSEEQFRDELRAWLAANVPANWKANEQEEGKAEHFETLRQWQKKVFDAGWAGVSWPKDYGGRGADVIQQAIFQEEWARAEARSGALSGGDRRGP